MCLYKCNSYCPSLLFVALFIILLCIGSHGVYVLSNMHNPFVGFAQMEFWEQNLYIMKKHRLQLSFTFLISVKKKNAPST